MDMIRHNMFLFSLMQGKGSAIGVGRGRAVAMRARVMFDHFIFFIMTDFMCQH
jgi:hypothetical protein